MTIVQVYKSNNSNIYHLPAAAEDGDGGEEAAGDKGDKPLKYSDGAGYHCAKVFQFPVTGEAAIVLVATSSRHSRERWNRCGNLF